MHPDAREGSKCCRRSSVQRSRQGLSCIKSIITDVQILSCMLVDDRSGGHDPPWPDGSSRAKASERSSQTQVVKRRPIGFLSLNIEQLIDHQPSQVSSRACLRSTRTAPPRSRSQHLNRAVIQHKSPIGSPCRFEFLKAFVLDPDMENVEVEASFKE